MAKEIWKGTTTLAPVPPTMVTCGTMEHPNVLTVAWTGILNTIPPKTYISVRPERYSYNLIKESGEFAINLTTRELVRAADFCGVRSGKDTDKFAAMSITPEECETISAPMLKESPISLECRVTDEIDLGSHHMFMADITAVRVDEKLIDKNGRLCIEKAGLVGYAHGQYFALGESLGTFGFSVRKKPLNKKGRAPKKK